ncbi:hypothetical protein QTH87_21565 [Variovorax sp. J22P168]|uniref:hypothetical protein n=1 Tax=Variovorax jilinensis TaxID=3053513 RepID=UPI00257840C2|nr:hypothetical protein [Variovorax sp. J22P168]MDM0015048.1 hypothetical protein [Variovorax sp. J22P168]
MKTLFIICAVLTGPLWIPFWLLAKSWKFFALLFLFGWLAGCSSTSNRFDRSPCACEFHQLENTTTKETDHV